jgi:hypothetical protein
MLIGASAWLLGAVTATAGSMIAVNQLAHGLFNQPAQLLGSAATADLDHDSSGQPAGGSPIVKPAASSAARRPAASQSIRHPAPASSPSPTSQLGTLLVSPDGSVTAECLPAGAHLLSWIPDQGFQADEANPGPAAVASVTFRGVGSTVVVRVSCRGGTPVAHLYWPSGGGHDE